MSFFSTQTEVPKSSILRAWNLSTQTLTDVQKILKKVRAKLGTRQVIEVRRIILEITSTLGTSIKENTSPKDVKIKLSEADNLVGKLSIQLEKLLKVDGIDKARMQVVTSRLMEIRSAINRKR